MSDSKSSYGEPVEEPRPVDDVVGSANEGIADAEAARRDAAASDGSQTDAAAEPAAQTSPRTPVEPAPSAYDDDSTFDSAMYEAHADDTATAWEPPAETVAVTPSEPVAPVAGEAYTERYAEPATERYAEPASERYAEPYAETAVVAPVATGYAAPQPIFVQAPEAPRLRGNRAAAGAIGLLAALAFGILYLALWLGVGMLDGEVTAQTLGSTALTALGTWALWVPVVVFFLAFWLLGAIINRGRWGIWVIFGLLVGVAAYLGHILGALFQAPFWMLTAREGAALTEAQLLAPLAIGAFIIGRELTIWFGAWVAARGARVTELNVEAQREYERTLEAGPQLTRV
jgi:hypothetical protein